MGEPHWPGDPPPPHVAGGMQVPQLGIRFPHPSPAGPQLMFWSWHVFGVHVPPEGTHLPATHDWLAGHVPQSSALPHPSPACPHDRPWPWHVSGWQPLLPQHTPGVPHPPHVCGAVHVPQLGMTPPQPSPAGPHWMLDGHACGVHMLDGGVQH
jgi:hypothetical protein